MDKGIQDILNKYTETVKKRLTPETENSLTKKPESFISKGIDLCEREEKSVNLALTSLIEFFENREFTGTFQLSPCETITNVKKFVESHLAIVKSKGISKGYLPYYERFLKFKEMSSSVSNANNDNDNQVVKNYLKIC